MPANIISINGEQFALVPVPSDSSSLTFVKAAVAAPEKGVSAAPSMFIIGQKYLIRTVTMIITGILVEQDEKFLKMDKAAWIADTGRFHDCLSKGTVNECEPAVSYALVGIGSIVDAYPWEHALPHKQG